MVLDHVGRPIGGPRAPALGGRKLAGTVRGRRPRNSLFHRKTDTATRTRRDRRTHRHDHRHQEPPHGENNQPRGIDDTNRVTWVSRGCADAQFISRVCPFYDAIAMTGW